MIPILASLIPTLVDKGIELFDKKFETDSDKIKAKQEYELLLSSKIQDAWNKEQEVVTERHKNDMQSDSWLSKNVRPLVLVYLMLLFTLAFVMQVPEEVLDMLQNLLMTVFVFYFGSRTLEKMTHIHTNGKGK